MLPVLKFRKSVPDYVDPFFGDFFPGLTSRYNPEVNILENDDAFVIEIAAPGFGKNDFKINLEKSTLTIWTERSNNEVNDEHYLRREFGTRSFKRSYGLPESVDQDKIKASYEQGILRIDIPKKEEAKPKPAQTIKIS